MADRACVSALDKQVVQGPHYNRLGRCVGPCERHAAEKVSPVEADLGLRVGRDRDLHGPSGDRRQGKLVRVGGAVLGHIRAPACLSDPDPVSRPVPKIDVLGHEAGHERDRVGVAGERVGDEHVPDPVGVARHEVRGPGVEGHRGGPAADGAAKAHVVSANVASARAHAGGRARNQIAHENVCLAVRIACHKVRGR